MRFKKIALIILVVLIIGALIYAISYRSEEKEVEWMSKDKLNVVVTNFVAYDILRNIANDNINLKNLLSPGVEAHGYEPTAQDLVAIENSDIFIYIGGNMENWTDKVLNSLNMSNTKVLRLMDTIDVIEEQEVDGAEPEEEDEGETEYDEHIWNSPTNTITIIQSLAELISEKDEENRETYQTNARKYIEDVKEVQAKIQEIVNNKVRNRLIFGDKMPMQYFLNEFELTASAAFNGCSTETEPSVATVAYLVEKVKEENIPVVLYIELSQGKIAKAIAEETGAEIMQIQSLHNISKEDFNNGETYVSLMTRNLDALKKALQ